MRRSRLVAAGVLLAAASPLLWRAQPPREARATGAANPGPRVFVPEPAADLGKVVAGAIVRHRFVIENRGRGELEVATRPRCGCTVVEHDTVIAPGGRGSIQAELKTRGMRGRFRKIVDVSTNDPEQANLQLILDGAIVEAVTVTPSTSPTMVLKSGETTDLDLGLQPRDEVTVRGAAADVPYARVQLQRGAERAFRLVVSVGPEAPQGHSQFVITISTDAEGEREVPIRVSCQKGIVVSPASFGFGARLSEAAAARTRSVLVRMADGEHRIRSATSDDPDLAVTVEPIAEGSTYRLVATYAGSVPRAVGPAVVTVATDDPRQPTLKIPLQGTRRANAVKLVRP